MLRSIEHMEIIYDTPDRKIRPKMTVIELSMTRILRIRSLEFYKRKK